jgi:hypothetical protein
MQTACVCLQCSDLKLNSLATDCDFQYLIYSLVGPKYPLNPVKGQSNLNVVLYKKFIFLNKHTYLL